jgi:hypothetical protein
MCTVVVMMSLNVSAAPEESVRVLERLISIHPYQHSVLSVLLHLRPVVIWSKNYSNAHNHKFPLLISRFSSPHMLEQQLIVICPRCTTDV